MGHQSKEHDKMKAIPEDELPQVTAFQDEFTRKFMDSTERVQEGYYLFRSGVNGFTMLFPENAKIGAKVYFSPREDYETFEYGGEEKPVAYYVKIRYQHGQHVNYLDHQLNDLRTYLQKNEKFKEITLPDRTIYYGKGKKEFEDVNDTVYLFFGYIKAKNRGQGVRFFYSVTCQIAERPCNLDVEKEEQKARLLMESVAFIVPDTEEQKERKRHPAKDIKIDQNNP